jgi:3D (Asp-Asp-Asp) domain-containing protein
MRLPFVMTMQATAFTHARQATAAGTEAHPGIVAADPAVLPIGTRIRVTGTDAWDGDYLVTDTGPAVKGRHIDLYVASKAEAKHFGKKTVRVEVRQLGKGKADARAKDARSPRRPE